MASVVCLLFLFLNSTLGYDLVVLSRSKSKWQTSRWKRRAELAPNHWIEIQADIRSRYLKFFAKDVRNFFCKKGCQVRIHPGDTHRREPFFGGKGSCVQSSPAGHCLCLKVGVL